MDRHILEEQRSMGLGMGMKQGVREAQELAADHFVHVMYYMRSGLQPDNKLLFLLFPY